MIDADLRRAVLGSFPVGTPLAVVAPRDKDWAPIVAGRADTTSRVIDLDDGSVAEDLSAVPHVLLEGIDDVEAPDALLRALREKAPAARLFTVVANAAYLKALLAFWSGVPLAKEHPLVHAELAPLFSAAGWRIIAINPVPDDSIPTAASLPFELVSPGICFKITDPAMLERSRIRAFIVVADRE